ncbi:MAG: hypothetical protein IPI64_03785 [Chloracidobacterium sp.]|nr:hypothetical protein [Chloracidobacterium sp.]
MQNDDTGTRVGYIVAISICTAILVSQFLFLLMIYFVKPELMGLAPSQSQSESERTPEIVLVLAVVSIVVLVASFVIKKVLIGQAVKTRVTALIFVASIFGCSLCESVTLFGLLTAFVANYPYFYAFFAAGIIGTILHFPSQSSIDAASYKT